MLTALELLNQCYFKKQSEFLEKIKTWGFNTNSLSQVVHGLDEIEKQHSKIDSRLGEFGL